MRIEKIEEKKNKFNVTVNNNTYLVSLYLMTLHKININDNYTLDQILKFINDALLEKYDELLAKKLTKMLTKQEVKSYLENQGANYQTIDILIKKYETYGFINDYQYILKYIDNHKHKEGKLLIEKKLLEKGINPNLLNKFLINHNEGVYAKEILQKRIKTIKNKSTESVKQTLYRHLVSKGFDETLSFAVTLDILKTYKGSDTNLISSIYDKRRSKGFDDNNIINYLLQKGYKYDEIKLVIDSKDD